MKKTLTLILALTMIVSLFAGLTVTASADETGGSWVLIGGADAIADTVGVGPVIITMTNANGTYALANDKGAGDPPTAVAVTADGDTLTLEEGVESKVIWYPAASEDESYVFNAAEDGSTWLYCTNANNGVRVGTNSNKAFVIDNDYLKNVTTGRFVGVYSSSGSAQDWRCYTSINSNITGQTLQFWKFDESAAPHTHVWSDWSSNGDGTHSRVCQAEDCPDEAVETDYCVDEDEDLVCDVCGGDMPEEDPNANPWVLIGGADAIDAAAAEGIVTITMTSGGKLYALANDGGTSNPPVAVAATVKGNKMSLDNGDNEAVSWNIEAAEGGYTIFSAVNGEIWLYSSNNNNGVRVGTNYAKVWTVEENYLKHAGTGRYMGVYNKTDWRAYTSVNNNIGGQTLQFWKYVGHVHDWTGTETTAPTCTARGVITYTCSGCGESYTELSTFAPHADADGDGLCDTCRGVVFHAAESLNDGDSLILVTGAFGAAMKGAPSGEYLAAAEINAQDGITVPTAENDIWTVKTVEGGFQLISSAGQYLVVDESGRLALGDETSGNTLWIVGEPVEGVTATGAYLYNPGAEKYVEYNSRYQNYQTYGAPTGYYENLYAFTFYTVPEETQPALEDGFYLLIGHGDDGWGVEFIDPEQKFEPNGNARDEWLLSSTLAVGDEIKVVRVENGAITGWWPDGPGTQYHVDEAHSGNVTIYFKTDYVNDWSEFGGYFYIGAVLKEKISADVYGCSLSLKGNIALNFYLIPSEELLADTDAYVTLGDAQFPIAEATKRVLGEDTLYLFPMSLHAKMMNDPVTLRAFDGEGNAVALYRHSNDENVTETGFTYSVQDYIRKTRETSSDARLIALVDAMSDYGSLAQVVFGYNVDNRAEVQGDLDSVTAESLAGFAAQVTEGTATGVSSNGGSLVLLSETAIRLYFKLDEGEIGDYTFKVGSKSVTPVETEDGWLVEIPNIAAKDLDKTYTVTVKSSAGLVLTVKYSAMSYAYSVLNGGSRSETLQDLVKGLVLYNQAANAYFG